MTSNDIPESLYQFITKNIDSIELMRVLFLLYEHQNRTWSVSEITRELRSVDSSIEIRLKTLYERKILAKKTDDPDKHEFVPHSFEVLARLKEFYEYNQVCPYRVIELIYSRPEEILSAFAEAFKIKKG